MAYIRILLLAVGSVTLFADVPLPESPAGTRAKGWLDVINRGDPEGIRSYFAKVYLKIIDAKPSSITLLVKARKADRFAKLTVSVQPEEPHNIQAVMLAPAERPAELAPKRLNESDAIAALKQEAERRTAADEFSGAVLIAKAGKTIYSGAYGLADREQKVANMVDTRFRIGSMNKMFTAVAVLQLVQAGKLSLDAPLGKYLTDYPNADIASKVTIHHLLTHTGGTGDFFGPEFDKNRLKLRDLKDHVTLYGKRGPAFTPGDQQTSR